jgi:hypothetical protein
MYVLAAVSLCGREQIEKLSILASAAAAATRMNS